MSLMHYLLEANLYLAAFYLLYVLLLRSETLYQLNRAYLLITSALAFVIPVLQMGILRPEVKHTGSIGMVSLDLSPVSVSILPAVTQPPKWTLADYALTVYGVVTAALLMYLVFKIIKLISLSKKGIAKRQNGFTVIEIPGQNVAFSFFGYLFVNTELLSSATILHHEQVHIRQKHSWDVIYFELFRIVNWFNPVVYLLQKSIKEVHEFIADQQAATLENGASNYADFLISNAYGLTPIQLTNSFFNKNLLKRRIIMLYQKKSGRAAKLKYLLTLPLMGGLLCASTMAFTNKNYAWVDIAPKAIATAKAEHKAIAKSPAINLTEAKNTLAAVNQTTAVANPTIPADSIFKKVEVNPIFPGGYAAFGEFLRNNIRYPKAAKDANVQGRVFVQFIVEKDGSLSDMKIVRDPGSGLGDEAVRVLSLSPKWTPGIQKGQPVRVAFTVPVNFSLDAGQVANPNSMQSVGVLPTAANGQPIYNAVEVNPTFPGGEQGFGDFLRKNIRYPKAAKDANVQGRVFIQFIVEADGSLSNMRVLRDPGTGLGDEAMRVLKLSPKWNPGIQKGEKVRVQYTVPINFSLADDSGPQYAKPLYAFIFNTIRYPKDAKDRNIQGRVFVSFTVNADKKAQDILVIRAPDKLLGDEVARVLGNFSIFSDWKTNTSYVIPVNFNLKYGDNVKDIPKAIDPQPVSNKYQSGALESVPLNEVVVVGYPTVH